MNITLAIDDQIVKTVRKIAIDRDTTLTQLVREYLIDVARTHDVDAKETARKFRELSESVVGNQGAEPRKWSRDEMYDQRFDESILGKALAARKAARKADHKTAPEAGK